MHMIILFMLQRQLLGSRGLLNSVLSLFCDINIAALDIYPPHLA